MIEKPITIKNMVLKNRIIAAPIVTNSGDDNGMPTAEMLEIYRQYAESGVGMMVAEQHTVHPWGRCSLKQPRLYDDASAIALQPITKIFRDKNIPIVAQLNFGARVTSAALLDAPDFEAVSPSGLSTPRKAAVEANFRSLKISEIEGIVQAFADAARRAVELSKFNGGVQIYASHGYLIGQFLSPLTNSRIDCYGGSLENRARILFQIVEAVRHVIPQAPLSVRLGASDQMPYQPENGLTLSESVWMAKQLAEMGVDWISVSGNHCVYGIGADDNDTAYFSPYSRAIRNAVKAQGVAVDCTGGIRTVPTADRLLADGVCDLIGIGRPLAADKLFLRKHWDM